MDGEELRTGSADSENGSDNSYVHVQVSSEDVRSMESQQQQPPPLPPLGEEDATAGAGEEDDEDLYGSGDEPSPPVEQDEAEVPEHVSPDPLFIDSPPEKVEEEVEEEEEEVGTPYLKPAPPIQTSAGVEDLPPVSSTSSSSAPPQKPMPSIKPSFQATGYLSFLNVLPPLELEIIYWRDIKLSAVVLGIQLVVLLTLTLNTFLHTMVLLLLSFLVVSLVYIITRIAIDTFYNKDAKNPFSDYLNRKITLPEDKILELTQQLVGKLDRSFNTLVRLLLFDNIKASLKFGLGLWLLSFVTNYLTFQMLMTLMIVVPFTVPPIYQKFQRQIDPLVDDAKARVVTLYNHVKENIPFFKKTKVE